MLALMSGSGIDNYGLVAYKGAQIDRKAVGQTFHPSSFLTPN
jgi:hypothetical protein